MSIEREIECIENEVKPALAGVLAAMESNDVEALADATAALVEATVALSEDVLETAVEEGVLEPEEAEAMSDELEGEVAEEYEEA
jgi:polyhydroxyalkanoate synthesis regulator phasin